MSTTTPTTKKTKIKSGPLPLPAPSDPAMQQHIAQKALVLRLAGHGPRISG